MKGYNLAAGLVTSLFLSSTLAHSFEYHHGSRDQHQEVHTTRHPARSLEDFNSIYARDTVMAEAANLIAQALLHKNYAEPPKGIALRSRGIEPGKLPTLANQALKKAVTWMSPDTRPPPTAGPSSRTQVHAVGSTKATRPADDWEIVEEEKWEMVNGPPRRAPHWDGMGIDSSPPPRSGPNSNSRNRASTWHPQSKSARPKDEKKG